MTSINSKDIYLACINGARHVMKNKDYLNQINVFPVRDSDTGSNLYMTMNTIVREAREGATVKDTMDSIAEAAINGARGNSGIIFAQYINGFSINIDQSEILTPNEFVYACQKAADCAYDAVEKPKEGTMISVMQSWSKSLVMWLHRDQDFISVLYKSYEHLERALVQTQYQLKELKNAGVVDSGAKGFTCFIKGLIEYLNQKKDMDDPQKFQSFEVIQEDDISMEKLAHGHISDIKHRYCTECLVENLEEPITRIRKVLSGYGDSLVIAGSRTKCRVHIHTNEPVKSFEYLSDVGDVVYKKVDDMRKQQMITDGKLSDIAIVTDSIADLPNEFIEKYQIHILHTWIEMGNSTYLDKLTLTPKQVIEYGKVNKKLPTSSQPDLKQIEHLLSYLSSHYKSIIYLSVSSSLSGTYGTVNNIAKKHLSSMKIDVIDTKTNSVAEGLLVKKAALMAVGGVNHEKIVSTIKNDLEKTKILVNVKSLDNMIKSGRLNVATGNIAGFLGIRPLVTLDRDGKGAIEKINTTFESGKKEIIKHLLKVKQLNGIESYSIGHVENDEEAKEMAVRLKEALGVEPSFVTNTSSVVASSAGAGALAVAYIMK